MKRRRNEEEPRPAPKRFGRNMISRQEASIGAQLIFNVQRFLNATQAMTPARSYKTFVDEPAAVILYRAELFTTCNGQSLSLLCSVVSLRVFRSASLNKALSTLGVRPGEHFQRFLLCYHLSQPNAHVRSGKDG